nr:D-hexose-6-phosphate mutarotase [Actinomycetota bacterium]
VTTEHSADTVVWNPWADKAAELPDLDPVEWTEMLCVEAGNVGPDAIVLGPDEEHTTGTTIAVS